MFLEEGFNVKVLLLPDGEDPDSFAHSHNADEFIAYIEQNKTDFIQFKLNLLSKDAGNDPQKRIELVREIARSISVIPDIITRRNYIRSCASQLHVDEESLVKGANALRIKKIEEDKKRREEEDRHNDEVVAAVSDTEEDKQEDVLKNIQFLDQVNSNKLDANFYNLVQLIVRYGERSVDLDGTIYSVGEVIIYTLENDEIAATRPVFQRIIDEFKLHSKDEGFRAETFFKFHSDPEVSAMAVEMIADQYQLSTIYSRQNISENVQRTVQDDEESHLGEQVTRMLYEIKLTVINQQIEDLNRGLKEAMETDNWERQKTLLAYQPQLMERRNEICHLLGNRIINI